MVLISDLDFSLPFKNPVIIFSLVLFIILFAPILFNRIRIPHIIGLILAGILVGPYGLNLLLRDSSIVLFGTVGLLYIMFTAGLEIDLEEFRKNRLLSLVFGLLTFSVPMVLGTLAAYYVLRFSLPSSLLFAGMMASHTLLAYPIARKYGIAQIRSVTLSIGGTIITDILALLVLAGVTGMTKGDVGATFWLRLAISTLVFGAVLFLAFPIIARWFFKQFHDHISQYIFVLAMVFLGSFLAELAGLEAIIGAFLSGLTLNRFIPHSSALMNRIEFVGNAFFIPFFLIGVGMLVNIRVLFQGWESLFVAMVMTVVAILTKYLAAWGTQKSFRLSSLEAKMIFGISTARVGATLAVVLVGYNIITGETADGEPIRLLNETVLNGAILMILVTCTVSSFVVEKASQQLALENENQADPPAASESILISLASPETVPALMELGLLLSPPKTQAPVYALHIVPDENGPGDARSSGKKMLQHAASLALAAGRTAIPLTRHDANIGSGIIYSAKEYGVSDLLIGLHRESSKGSFLGDMTEAILARVTETVFIYKSVQPLNTLKRMVAIVPPKAELEPGFRHWFVRLASVAKEVAMPVEVYATKAVIKELTDIQTFSNLVIKTSFHTFEDWDDFLILSREVSQNDLFVIVTSRKGHPSYQALQDKLPAHLTNYFRQNSLLLVYPKQLDNASLTGSPEHADLAPQGRQANDASKVHKVGKLLKTIFKRTR